MVWTELMLYIRSRLEVLVTVEYDNLVLSGDNRCVLTQTSRLLFIVSSGHLLRHIDTHCLMAHHKHSGCHKQKVAQYFGPDVI